MNLLHALLNSVLPVFILAGLGWFARKKMGVELRDPSKLAIYLMSPGLIMHSILNSRLAAGEVGKIAGFTLVLTALMIALTLLAGRLLGWSASERSASVLGTAFINGANYGLPVVLLSFGEAGFERAAIFTVVETMLMYTVAVFFAARGRMDWRDSVKAVFRLPLFWAAAVAMVVRVAGITLPDFILKPISLLASGAIVLVILLLGMQVAGIQLRGALSKIGVGTVLRLVVSPVLGMALVAWLRPDPLTAKVLVLESAMPAAVNTTLLAVQFGAEPDLVSGVTLVSTVLSMGTVTFWVWLLKDIL